MQTICPPSRCTIDLGMAIDSVSRSPISVLIAEDHAAFRKSLKVFVEMDKDIKVVAEAKNGKEAVRLYHEYSPDIVIMDIAMPLFNGLEATHQIMEANPAAKVLILSSHADPEYVHQAINLGASGYVIKQASAPLLANAIREVMKGKAYFCATIPKQLRNECQRVFDKKK